MRKLVLIFVAVLVMSACGKAEKAVATGTAAGGAKSQPAAEAPAGVEVGSAMPSYAAKRLDGSQLELAAEKGKVVFLNVWATWCPPCRAEIPELQKLHDKYASRRFEVIGVSVDEGNGDDVRKYVQEQKMTYPVALDPDGKLANLLQTSVLPTSVLLDRNGRIVWKSYGQVDMADPALTKALDAALGS